MLLLTAWNRGMGVLSKERQEGGARGLSSAARGEGARLSGLMQRPSAGRNGWSG